MRSGHRCCLAGVLLLLPACVRFVSSSGAPSDQPRPAETRSSDLRSAGDRQPGDRPSTSADRRAGEPLRDGVALGTPLWARGLGGAGGEYGKAIAVDSSGNLYCTGFFGGTVDFGGGPLVSAGNVDIFLASYDPGGGYRFAKRLGGAGDDRGSGIVVDGSGNVGVTGGFQGVADFDGTPLTGAGGRDIFVASFTSGGGLRFAKRYGGASDDAGYAIAADSSGNLHIVGSHSGGMDFGGGTLTSAGSYDLFVAGLSSSGAFRYAKSFGGSSTDIAWGIAAGAGGDVLVTGSYLGSPVNLGGAALANAGQEDVFIAGLTSTGGHRFSLGFGDSSSDVGYGVAIDGSGNAYVAGQFYGTIDLGGGPLVSVGDVNTFVASFTSTGAHRWSRRFGIAVTQALAADSVGNVHLTGWCSGAVDFGGGVLASAGGNDVFVASYSAVSGAHRFSRRFGGAGDDRGEALAVTSNGAILVTGWFNGTASFGGTPLTSVGGSDAFLLKLAP